MASRRSWHDRCFPPLKHTANRRKRQHRRHRRRRRHRSTEQWYRVDTNAVDTRDTYPIWHAAPVPMPSRGRVGLPRTRDKSAQKKSPLSGGFPLRPCEPVETLYQVGQVIPLRGSIQQCHNVIVRLYQKLIVDPLLGVSEPHVSVYQASERFLEHWQQ